MAKKKDNVKNITITIEGEEWTTILDNTFKKVRKDLKVDGYKIDFDSNKYSYTLKIKNEKKLDITYTKDDLNSSVSIMGNDNLKDGSIIEVKVTAENQSISIYKINIEKGSNINVGTIVIIISLILGMILYFVSNKKKSNI